MHDGAPRFESYELPAKPSPEPRGAIVPRSALLLLLFAVGVSGASAQVCVPTTIDVTPANPTTQTAVTFSFLGFSEGCSTLTYRMEGNTILIENAWDCGIEHSTQTRHLAIGPLPAGTYDVRVFSFRFAPGDSPCGSRSFTVADAGAPFVPTLSVWNLVATAISLGGLGYLAVRRVQ